MNIRFNLFFKLAAASMLTGTLLGARFGHVGQLDEQRAALFQKANFYNVSNSLGLFACSLVAAPSWPLKVAGAGFVLAQLLFVMPLYVFATNGKNQVLRKIIPAGGGSMIVGWSALIFA